MKDNHRFSRRELIALTGTGAAAGLAGCFGNGGSGGSGGDSGGSASGGSGSGGSGGDGTPDPAELPPVHVFTDYNNDAWQQKWENQIASGFSDETGIGVNVEYAGFQGSGEQRLATLLQSGDPPDLYSSTFPTVADLWAADRLATANELNEAIRSVAGESTAPPWEDSNGDAYHTSHGYYAGTFVYRTDIYDQLGLSVPTTFDEMLANAKAIDEAEEVEARGMAVPGQKTGKSESFYEGLYARMGCTIYRWKSDAREEAEVWFPKEPAVELLNYVKELAQYSPDPISMNWGPSLKAWAGGRIAQMYHLNAWAAGVAAGVSEELGLATGIAPMPLRDISKEESRVGDPAPDGWSRFADSANPRGATELLRYLYGSNIERTAKMYETEPMRFVPAYADIMASDAYQSIEHFQEFPEHLELNRTIQNEIVPEYYGNNAELNPDTGPTLYAERFYWSAEMMNQVLAGDVDPEAAYEEAREKAEQRLEEGRRKLR